MSASKSFTRPRSWCSRLPAWLSNDPSRSSLTLFIAGPTNHQRRPKHAFLFWPGPSANTFQTSSADSCSTWSMVKGCTFSAFTGSSHERRVVAPSLSQKRHRVPSLSFYICLAYVRVKPQCSGVVCAQQLANEYQCSMSCYGAWARWHNPSAVASNLH
jgi:hypothetical protein